MKPRLRQLRVVIRMLLFVSLGVLASCGDSSTTGLADTRTETSVSGDGAVTAETTTSTSTSTTSTSVQAATNSSTTAPTTAAPTTGAPTTAAPTTAVPTTAAVAAGLPTPDDVARQYYALCVETDSRELVDKWFEPGVLDELNCRRSDEESLGQGFTELSPCDEIPDAAGEATHGCFVYYEGGGYTLLVGDLGRGYRGLAVTFVVD